MNQDLISLLNLRRRLRTKLQTDGVDPGTWALIDEIERLTDKLLAAARAAG